MLTATIILISITHDGGCAELDLISMERILVWIFEKTVTGDILKEETTPTNKHESSGENANRNSRERIRGNNLTETQGNTTVEATEMGQCQYQLPLLIL